MPHRWHKSSRDRGVKRRSVTRPTLTPRKFASVVRVVASLAHPRANKSFVLHRHCGTFTSSRSRQPSLHASRQAGRRGSRKGKVETQRTVCRASVDGSIFVEQRRHLRRLRSDTTTSRDCVPLECAIDSLASRISALFRSAWHQHALSPDGPRSPGPKRAVGTHVGAFQFYPRTCPCV